MKKIIVFFVILIITISLESQTNCIEPKYEDNCSQLISSIFDDYVYLKSRAFNSDLSVDVMFSVNLKRNVLYIFNVCESDGKANMIINLHDNKDKIVASSVNSQTHKNSKIIAYKPDDAGKYYISAKFAKNDKNCCLILYGMITKNIEQYINVSKK